MCGFVQVVRNLVLAAIICVAACVDAHPSGSSRTLGAYGDDASPDQVVSGEKLEALPPVSLLAPGLTGNNQQRASFSEPFALQARAVLPNEASEMSAKWAELQSRIHAEENTLRACRSGDVACHVAARRFLSIIELGRQRQGRAKLGEINRTVNLSIKPVSDWVQYGVDDFWSAPIATLSIGAGDCEDYAVAKYVALRESGTLPDDLRLLIVRDIKRRTNHAVVAVHHENEWLILDNRTMILVNAQEARHYQPLFVLDHRGIRTFAITTVRGSAAYVGSLVRLPRE